MSLVTVERAVRATSPFFFQWWGRPRFATFLSSFVFVLVSISMFPQLNQYQVIRSPVQRFSSCIRQMESSEQEYLRYLPLIHQLSPFLVNLISASLIIIAISRSKASLHQLSTRQALQQQANERKELRLGPIICLITQIPALILLFLDICDYQSNVWFVHLILILILYYL
jgi:hypothetical protein